MFFHPVVFYFQMQMQRNIPKLLRHLHAILNVLSSFFVLHSVHASLLLARSHRNKQGYHVYRISTLIASIAPNPLKVGSDNFNFSIYSKLCQRLDLLTSPMSNLPKTPQNRTAAYSPKTRNTFSRIPPQIYNTNT